MSKTVKCVIWIAIALAILPCRPSAAGDLDVRAFGAKGDGISADSAAFKAAIDAASSSGGGVVHVGAGKYLIAEVELKSNVTLHLDAGAILLGSHKAEDFHGKTKAVLQAMEAEHIGIEGQGVIDAQTTADYGARWGAPEVPKFRTHTIHFEKCRDVTLNGITVQNSDSWTIHLRRCEHVRIDGISILDNYKRLNTDGIDPNSCKDVKIARCHIVTGDDSIVLKSTEPYPCEDIEVTDCLLESATAALKIGTESHGDFRHIRFKNCRIVNSPVGVGFFIKDGAVAQDVVASDIDMQMCPPTFHSQVPLYIDIEKRHADSKVGVVRDVTFQNIHITASNGLLLQGMPESHLENIALRNITFDVKDPGDYAKRKKPVGGTRTTRDARDTLYARVATYAAFANMKNLTIDGFRVNISGSDWAKFSRSALSLFSVDGATLHAVNRKPADGDPPVIEQHECKNIRVD